MYSPVNAILAEVNFGYWRDLSKHLKSFQEEATQVLGKQTYEHWVKNIEELCGDTDRLLVLSILLLLEDQMRVLASSPHPAQSVLLNLLNSLVEGDKSQIEGVLQRGG